MDELLVHEIPICDRIIRVIDEGFWVVGLEPSFTLVGFGLIKAFVYDFGVFRLLVDEFKLVLLKFTEVFLALSITRGTQPFVIFDIVSGCVGDFEPGFVFR